MIIVFYIVVAAGLLFCLYLASLIIRVSRNVHRAQAITRRNPGAPYPTSVGRITVIRR